MWSTKCNVGQFPAQIKAPVSYGSGVQALVRLLHVKCQLSYQNIRELFDDLFGQPINGATLQQSVKNTYDKLEPVEQHIKDKLLLSPVLHTDETG
ncbi:MAG: transposase [Saprospiraceae bacterium]